MERCILDTEKLKTLLKRQEMTQRELAEKAGTTEVSVSRYLRGQRTPRLLTLAAIAQVLGVSIDDLLTERRRK